MKRDERKKEPSASRGSKRPLRMNLVRAAVLEVYAAVRSEGQLADRALDRVLRRERALFSGERRAVGEAVFGLLRKERLLDFALFGGDPPRPAPSFMYAARLAAFEVLEGAAPAATASALGLPASLVPRLERVRDPLPANLSPKERVAIEGSLPDFLAERLVADLGAESALAFARAISTRAPLTLRVNTLKTSRDALIQRLSEEGVAAKPTRLSPLGLIVEERINVFALPSFKEGLFEVQDEGSQLLSLIVGARPGERIADTCAGAGGKTLALAAAMGNKGELWAMDVGPERLDELAKRARRAGVHNVRVKPIPGGAAADRALKGLAAKLDRVLVDAPCTGLGALRRSPDARYRFEPEDFARHATRQRELLERFSRLVRPGGRLVYATCSVAREEDEAVVEAFLAATPGFRVVPVREALPPEARAQLEGPYLVLLPHVHGTDGFFAAVLERVE
ncbi:MAG: RsmB/NOP family class I SAM-dependent RNA methyltransferase [Myxococcales bacterium]|jgi:16S rRNA (cytosine967-C5)-methyltransferase